MIKVEGVIHQDTLIEAMHNVTLANNPDVFPYGKADISIETMSMNDFLPTTLYVVRPGLHFQQQLRQDLRKTGHDPLTLDGGLMLRQGGASCIGLVPPIVEDDPEYGPCLIDGHHRVYTGRKLAIQTLNVLHIRNALPATPIYATPNNWEEVVEYDDTPTNPALKKNYRANPRQLYRDFSKINGSAMRS